MKGIVKTVSISVFWAVGAGMVIAEDNPDGVLTTSVEALQSPSPVTAKGVSVEERWQKFLAGQPWDTEAAGQDGLLFDESRDLIISYAMASPKVRIGQPGWIESRVAAYQVADMQAKAAIVRYLSEGIDAKRKYSYLETARFEDGEIEEIRNLSKVEGALLKIRDKSLALADAGLDAALKKLDPDYDPSEFEAMGEEQKVQTAEQLVEQKSRAWAMRSLTGVTPIYSSEGEADGAYAVLVAVAWTPKLNRVALSLLNGEYNIPKREPAKPLAQQIPEDINSLIYTLGTRVFIDENGDYAVISFSQAEPRKTSPARQLDAIQTAKKVAAQRARANIAFFVKEGVVLEETLEDMELFRDYADFTSGAVNQRDYIQKIEGKKTSIELKGMHLLKKWSAEHPLTGQRIAGAVIAWTPSSKKLSEKMDMATKQPKEDLVEDKGKVENERGDFVPPQPVSIPGGAY